MAFNPCPCMSLQQASKVLAIFDVVSVVLSMILIAIGAPHILENPPTNDEKSQAIITLVVSIIVGFLMLILAFKLYNSAKNRCYSGCKTWMWITIVLTAVNCASFAYTTAMSETEESEFFAEKIISIAYKMFEILVVYAFMQEMLYQPMIQIITLPSV